MNPRADAAQLYEYMAAQEWTSDRMLAAIAVLQDLEDAMNRTLIEQYGIYGE